MSLLITLLAVVVGIAMVSGLVTLGLYATKNSAKEARPTTWATSGLTESPHQKGTGAEKATEHTAGPDIIAKRDADPHHHTP